MTSPEGNGERLRILRQGLAASLTSLSFIARNSILHHAAEVDLGEKMGGRKERETLLLNRLTLLGSTAFARGDCVLH